MALGIADEVADYEEVVDKAHALYHVQFIFELLFRVVPAGPVAPREALAAEAGEIAEAVALALGELEMRQVVVPELEVERAHFGDLYRVVHRVGVVGEQGAHLVLALEIELRAAEAQPVRVVDGLSHLDAHEHILIVGVLTRRVVRVVRGAKWDARLAVYAQHSGGRALLLRHAVVLYLEIEPVRAEQLAQFHGLCLGAGIIAGIYHARYRPGHAAGQADEPLGVLMQERPVYSRADVKALGEASRDEIAEVAVARLVAAEQYQVGVLVVYAVLPAAPVAGRDVDLAADNRLYPLTLRGLVKRDSAVHHAVVGDGAGALAELLRPLYQRVYAARTVEQAVFAVNVQMDERQGSAPPLISPAAGPRLSP